MSRSQRRKGSAMLEFAVGAAVMLALFAGTFQFGLAFYRYNLLYNAVRNAAQYASLRSYDSDSPTPSETFREAVANMAVYGTPTEGVAPIVPGLTTDKIDVKVTFSRGIPENVTISVTDFRIDAVFKTFTFANKPSLTFPYLGRYGAP